MKLNNTFFLENSFAKVQRIYIMTMTYVYFTETIVILYQQILLHLQQVLLGTRLWLSCTTYGATSNLILVVLNNNYYY